MLVECDKNGKFSGKIKMQTFTYGFLINTTTTAAVEKFF